MPNKQSPEIFRTSYFEYADTLEAMRAIAKTLRTNLTDVQKNAVSEYVELYLNGKLPKIDTTFANFEDDYEINQERLSLRIWVDDEKVVDEIAKKGDKGRPTKKAAIYRIATARYVRMMQSVLKKASQKA